MSMEASNHLVRAISSKPLNRAIWAHCTRPRIVIYNQPSYPSSTLNGSLAAPTVNLTAKDGGSDFSQYDIIAVEKG